MKNNIVSLALWACIFSLQAEDTYLYQEEFNNLKNDSPYQDIFREEIDPILQSIQRDIENFKELTSYQRMLIAFTSLDALIVTSEKMPLLHAYIHKVAKAADIYPPVIFITNKECFFNAYAHKIFMSSGGILIGQKLLLGLSDQELEAIISHEIAHIKYNHVNKNFALSIAGTAGFYAAIHCLQKTYSLPDMGLIKVILASQLSSVINALIINKSFEKQADEFAYATMNQGEGLISSFKKFQEKESINDNDYKTTYGRLQAFAKNPKIELGDKFNLKLRYYLAKLSHDYHKWVSGTFLAPHPLLETRIKTIQDYLDSQEQSMVIV